MSSKKHADKFAPIKDVLVSAKVGGDSQLEKLNEKALGKLFNARFKIQNTNGEIDFSLTNLEDKIVKAAHGFVFLPIPTEFREMHAPQKREFFREIFKAASLFVGAQTGDPNLRLSDAPDAPLKPIVLVNHKGCWDPLRELVQHMHEIGVVRQDPGAIFKTADTVDEAVEILKKAHKQLPIASFAHMDQKPRHKIKGDISPGEDPNLKHKPDFNICVFCSASTKNPQLLDIAEQLGNKIASQNWGLISGMGSESMMGKVVEGAIKVKEKTGKGWIGGSNLRRIMDMEGVPRYYDKLWLKPDIYTRMEVMIEQSQAAVVMPGGMGTVQELMAMLLLKYNKEEGHDYLMSDKKFGNKPIILVNQELDTGQGKFWQPVVAMADRFGFKDDIIVVDTVEQAMEILKTHRRGDSLSRFHRH